MDGLAVGEGDDDQDAQITSAIGSDICRKALPATTRTMRISSVA